MSDDPRLTALLQALGPVIKDVVHGTPLHQAVDKLNIWQKADIAMYCLDLEHDVYLFLQAHPAIVRLLRDYLAIRPGEQPSAALIALRLYFAMCTQNL